MLSVIVVPVSVVLLTELLVCDSPEDSVAEVGYFGTGRNFVREGALSRSAVRFTARMRRGSDLFGGLERIDFIKCDIEGYERVVIPELRPLIERHHPTVLIETDGDTRHEIIKMFSEMGYQAYMLDAGREVALDADSDKDIIFRFE